MSKMVSKNHKGSIKQENNWDAPQLTAGRFTSLHFHAFIKRKDLEEFGDDD
jgi:hypothetical protein